MEEGLGGDEEGGGAHPQQRDELQEPEAEGLNGERQKMFKRSHHLQNILGSSFLAGLFLIFSCFN